MSFKKALSAELNIQRGSKAGEAICQIGLKSFRALKININILNGAWKTTGTLVDGGFQPAQVPWLIFFLKKYLINASPLNQQCNRTGFKRLANESYRDASKGREPGEIPCSRSSNFKREIYVFLFSPYMMILGGAQQIPSQLSINA